MGKHAHTNSNSSSNEEIDIPVGSGADFNVLRADIETVSRKYSVVIRENKKNSAINKTTQNLVGYATGEQSPLINQFYGRSKAQFPDECWKYQPGSLASVPVPYEKIPAIIFEVYLSVLWVHQQWFAHCDVNPANILLGDDGLTKLIDFEHAVDVRLGSDDIVSTPAYAPPEVKALENPDNKERKIIYFALDVWGIGATLYTLYARRPPLRDKEGKFIGFDSEQDVKDFEAIDDNAVNAVPIIKALMATSPEERLKAFKEFEKSSFFNSINKKDFLVALQHGYEFNNFIGISTDVGNIKNNAHENVKDKIVSRITALMSDVSYERLNAFENLVSKGFFKNLYKAENFLITMRIGGEPVTLHVRVKKVSDEYKPNQLISDDIEQSVSIILRLMSSSPQERLIAFKELEKRNCVNGIPIEYSNETVGFSFALQKLNGNEKDIYEKQLILYENMFNEWSVSYKETYNYLDKLIEKIKKIEQHKKRTGKLSVDEEHNYKKYFGEYREELQRLSQILIDRNYDKAIALEAKYVTLRVMLVSEQYKTYQLAKLEEFKKENNGEITAAKQRELFPVIEKEFIDNYFEDFIGEQKINVIEKVILYEKNKFANTCGFLEKLIFKAKVNITIMRGFQAFPLLSQQLIDDAVPDIESTDIPSLKEWLSEEWCELRKSETQTSGFWTSLRGLPDRNLNYLLTNYHNAQTRKDKRKYALRILTRINDDLVKLSIAKEKDPIEASLEKLRMKVLGQINALQDDNPLISQVSREVDSQASSVSFEKLPDSQALPKDNQNNQKTRAISKNHRKLTKRIFSEKSMPIIKNDLIPLLEHWHINTGFKEGQPRSKNMDKIDQIIEDYYKSAHDDDRVLRIRIICKLLIVVWQYLGKCEDHNVFMNARDLLLRAIATFHRQSRILLKEKSDINLAEEIFGSILDETAEINELEEIDFVEFSKENDATSLCNGFFSKSKEVTHLPETLQVVATT